MSPRENQGLRWSAGPGLLLALEFLALLTFLALLASAGRAETTVGLDAQGVDPRAAVDNRWGLDVRDELGRPVSGEKVLAEMKGAAMARAADNTFTSRLPKARAVLPALELLAQAAAAFRLASPGVAIPELNACLPGGRPKLSVLWLVVPVAAAQRSFCCRAGAPLLLSRSRQNCPEVLRC